MTTELNKLLIAIVVLMMSITAPLFAGEIVGTGKHAPRFLFIIPVGHKRFVMPMDPADTIGSTMNCMDKVHKRGGGTCEIEAHSLKTGKHNQLSPKYRDVFISVKSELGASAKAE